MTATRPIGLGEPELPGKLSLFRPPEIKKTPAIPDELSNKPAFKPGTSTQKRIRTTLDLTREALQVIQDIQGQHRLKTGKVLPLWKAVSQMIESCGRGMQKKKHGKTMH